MRVDEGERLEVGTYPGWMGNGGIVRMKKVKEKNQSGFEVAGEIYSRVPESEWPRVHWPVARSAGFERHSTSSGLMDRTQGDGQMGEMRGKYDQIEEMGDG